MIDNSALKDVTVNATDEIRLPCDVTTDPMERSNLHVEWHKDGVRVDPTNDDAVSLDPTDFSLIVHSSRVVDTGRYNCIANNGLDEAMSNVVLVTVQGQL